MSATAALGDIPYRTCTRMPLLPPRACLGDICQLYCDIVLRFSMKNRDDDWVWADIRPATWKTLLRSEKRQVGAFEEPRLDGAGFLRGRDAFHLLD